MATAPGEHRRNDFVSGCTLGVLLSIVDIAIIAGQIGSEAEPTAATFYVGYLLPPVAFAIAWFMAICPSVARFGYGMLQGLAYGLSLCFAFLCCLILVWWRFA